MSQHGRTKALVDGSEALRACREGEFEQTVHASGALERVENGVIVDRSEVVESIPYLRSRWEGVEAEDRLHASSGSTFAVLVVEPVRRVSGS